MIFANKSARNNENKAESNKPSFISSKYISCLKEEILSLEKKKEGNRKIVSAFYTYKEWGIYCGYTIKSEALIQKAHKAAKIGAVIGAVGGGVMSDEKFVIPGAIVGAVAGAIVSYFFAYPKMIKEFKSIRDELTLQPQQNL